MVWPQILTVLYFVLWYCAEHVNGMADVSAKVVEGGMTTVLVRVFYLNLSFVVLNRTLSHICSRSHSTMAHLYLVSALCMPRLFSVKYAFPTLAGQTCILTSGYKDALTPFESSWPEVGTHLWLQNINTFGYLMVAPLTTKIITNPWVK